MMEKVCITLVAAAALFQLSAAAAVADPSSADGRAIPGPRIMVCYFGSWSVYRPGNGKFDVEQIDPNLCTHVIYGFAALNNDTMDRIIAYDPWNDECGLDIGGGQQKCAFRRFTGLKNRNPSLKTLLAIGGWNEGSEKYSKMAKDPVKRANFVRSVVDMLTQYGFDGLDFDWEYPGARGGDPLVDKANFITILKELKAAFGTRFMLTSAVAIGKGTIDVAYDVPELNKYLDHIHVMSYDFHGAWETETGHNAPLYGNSLYDVGDEKFLNLEWGIKYWLHLGADPAKLIMGIPDYGRGFLLDNPNINGIKAPARLPIDEGPYSRLNGSWNYNEIVEKQLEGGWTVVQDSCYQAPFMYKGRQWIGYDDVPSVVRKAQFAAYMNIGGILTWSIDQDDFKGWNSADGQTFTLTRAMKNAMLAGANTPPSKPAQCVNVEFGSTTAATTPTTTTPTTTTPTTTTPTTTTPTTTTPTTTTPTTTTPTTTTPTTTTPTTTPTTTTPSTTRPTTTTSRATTTRNPLCDANFKCPASNGFFPRPGTCGSAYYSCIDDCAYNMICPDSSIFDPEIKKCVRSEIASCNTFTCPRPDGFFPMPNQCTGQFYVCVSSSYTISNCPADSIFDPAVNHCIEPSRASCKP